MDTPANRSTEAWVCRRPCTEMIGIEGSCFFNTAAHRDSCPSGCDTSKLLSDGLKNKLYYDCFQKVLYHYSHQTRMIQTFSRKRRVRIFCFWRRAHRTTKASAAHDRAASAQAQYAADAYFFAVPPLRMGESGHRLRFDVIFRNTPAFPAPLCRATVEQSETERFYPTSCR